jgi:hypothetical protein
LYTSKEIEKACVETAIAHGGAFEQVSRQCAAISHHERCLAEQTTLMDLRAYNPVGPLINTSAFVAAILESFSSICRCSALSPMKDFWTMRFTPP